MHFGGGGMSAPDPACSSILRYTSNQELQGTSRMKLVRTTNGGLVMLHYRITMICRSCLLLISLKGRCIERYIHSRDRWGRGGPAAWRQCRPGRVPSRREARPRPLRVGEPLQAPCAALETISLMGLAVRVNTCHNHEQDMVYRWNRTSSRWQSRHER